MSQVEFTLNFLSYRIFYLSLLIADRLPSQSHSQIKRVGFFFFFSLSLCFIINFFLVSNTHTKTTIRLIQTWFLNRKVFTLDYFLSPPPVLPPCSHACSFHWQWTRGWWEELQAARPLDMQNVSLQQQQQQLASAVFSFPLPALTQPPAWLCPTMQLPCVVFHPQELGALLSPAFPRGWSPMGASWGEAKERIKRAREEEEVAVVSSQHVVLRSNPSTGEGGWGTHTYATINTPLTALTFNFKAPHSAVLKSNSGVTGEIWEVLLQRSCQTKTTCWEEEAAAGGAKLSLMFDYYNDSN